MPGFCRPKKLFSILPLCLQVLPQVEQPQTGMNEGVKVGLIGIGALVALGGAFFVARKLLSSQLPKVQKVCPCPSTPLVWQLCSPACAALRTHQLRHASIERCLRCQSQTGLLGKRLRVSCPQEAHERARQLDT